MSKEYIYAHIGNLGFKTIASYQDWCEGNGFSTSLNKGVHQLNSESNHQKKSRSLHYLKESNKKIAFWRVIELIKSNAEGLSKALESNAIYLGISVRYTKISDKDLFLDMLTYLEKKTNLLENTKYLDALVHILSHKDMWIRSWDSWKPQSHNTDRQFSSFIRYLFAKYDVPSFFDSVWIPMGDIRKKEQEWFIHVGQGHNILKAPGLIDKYPMTKKMAHYFMQAPNDFNFDEAWKYGQIKSVGASDRLVEIFRPTPLFRTSLENDKEFKFSLIKFFVDNPMLDTVQIGPVIDYVWEKKYGSRNAIVNGVNRLIPPEQPNFSMTGRTPDTLLAQVERWHNQLGKEKKGRNLSWDHSKDIQDFEYVEGSASNHNQKIWRIQQLLSSNELSTEGRAMKHCVASYAYSCSSGATTIWSLTIQDDLGVQKLITIEVGKSAKKVYQTRGHCNRMPTQKEKFIISKWTTSEGIAYN
jgi:hypothetical protein